MDDEYNTLYCCLYPNCTTLLSGKHHEKRVMVSNRVDAHFTPIRHQRIHIIVVTDPIECEVRHVCLISRQKDHVYALVCGCVCVCINGQTDGAV